jgi:hypothetical protein
MRMRRRNNRTSYECWDIGFFWSSDDGLHGFSRRLALDGSGAWYLPEGHSASPQVKIVTRTI